MGSSLHILPIIIYHVSTRQILIQNAGFEEDGPVDDNTYVYYGGISDWQPYESKNANFTDTLWYDWSWGLVNPYGSDLFPAATTSHAPEGSLISYIAQSDSSKRGKGILGFSQTLSETLHADTIYTLRVWVGNPASNTFAAYNEYYYFDAVGFPGYRIDLLAGDDIIAQDDNNNDVALADGEWIESILIAGPFTANETNIGEALTIRLINLNKDTVGKEVQFDDIRLDAVSTLPTIAPTSEPTAVPTIIPTHQPTTYPTVHPSLLCLSSPTHQPYVQCFPYLSSNSTDISVAITITKSNHGAYTLSKHTSNSQSDTTAINSVE